MTIWLLTHCGQQQTTQSVDGTTGYGLRNEHERLDQQLAMGMLQNADSTLCVIDSLQAHDILPLSIADFERGTCYTMMEEHRVGEYYYKKSLEGKQLFMEWPDAYYRASTNLAILLSRKNDEQGALQVATTALNMLRQRTEEENGRWESALLFNIGNSQVRLGYRSSCS